MYQALFFSLSSQRSKDAKKKKLKNKITPGLRLGDTKKEKVQDSIFDNIFFFSFKCKQIHLWTTDLFYSEIKIYT